MNLSYFRYYSQVALLALLATVVGGCARPVADDPEPDWDLVKKVRQAFAEEGAGAAEAKNVEPAGTGWGTLRGTFVFDAAPPARKPLNVTRDRDICAPGGRTPLNEALLVDESTKGIANIVIYLREPSRVDESAQPNDDTVLYDQKDCIFLTHVFTVMVGQTMEIKNSDTESHNTAIQETPFNQTIPKLSSTTYQVVKQTATPKKITCGIHPWMVGYYLAKKDGYMAVTKPDGTFEIANVPAGEELEFQVWHESSSAANHFLHLKTPQAKELGWTKKGRFKITLEEGSTKELKLTVPASAFKT